jgi:hypothetical protein
VLRSKKFIEKDLPQPHTTRARATRYGEHKNDFSTQQIRRKSMRQEAVFLNGVYEDVLREILLIQEELPEHVMYLQPYSSEAIVHLRDAPPTPEQPVRLYISVTDDLPTISYAAEIVGWDDKTRMSKNKHRVLSRVVWTLQPNETGLYDASHVEGKQSVNLLHVRRMQRLKKPFIVAKLIKTGDGEPVSTGRTTSGGWVYVKLEEVEPQDQP